MNKIISRLLPVLFLLTVICAPSISSGMSDESISSFQPIDKLLCKLFFNTTQGIFQSYESKKPIIYPELHQAVLQKRLTAEVADSCHTSINSLSVLNSNSLKFLTSSSKIYLGGDTALHLAAKLNQADDCQLLLSSGANPNIYNNFGFLPIHFALINKNVDLVKLFLKHKSQREIKSSENITLSHLALAFGCADIVRDVLKYDISLTDQTKTRKLTPLHLAVANGNYEIEDVVQKNFKQFCLRDSDMATPFDIAIQNGDIKFTDIFIRARMSVNAVEEDDYPPLHRALKFAQLDVVKRLLMEQPLINTLDKAYGYSALTWAAQRSVDYVKLLLENGANPNFQDRDGRFPLSRAVSAENIKLLISAGADIYSESKEGWFPVFYQAYYPDLVEEYLKEGYDIEASTSKGLRLLHICCWNGKLPSIKRLLELGADVNAETRNGDRPLNYAMLNGNGQRFNEISNFLIEKGATLGSPKETIFIKDGWTALHCAVHVGNLEAVKALLKAGYDINFQSPPEKLTALHWAVSSEFPEIVSFLLENGANKDLKTVSGRRPIDLCGSANRRRKEIIELLGGTTEIQNKQ